MFKRLSLIISASLIAGCGGSGGSSPSPIVTPTPTPPVITAPVDEFAVVRSTAKSQVAQSNAPAVSIAIMKAGEIVFAQAYGTKKHDGINAVDPDTLFQLGSTTKMFTAVAALQLVDENVITLDQSLPNALPGISLSEEQSGWHDITVQHLLTHQGGFEDYVDWHASPDLMDHALNGFPSEFDQMNPAGKFWNYSNPNWSYLGAIVEHHRGMDYGQVMAQNVFEPLDMLRTTMSYDQVKSDGNYALGVGYGVTNGELSTLNADNLEQIVEPIFGKPAGGYTWSTASELAKMGDFLLNGNTDVLSDTLRQQMSTAQVDLNMGLNSAYGYGLFVHQGMYKNNQWLPLASSEHGGNTLNYSNMFWVFPEQDVTIVIMSSGYSTDFRATLFAAIESVIGTVATVEAPKVPVATQLFDHHVGQYVFDFGMVEISNDNGQLKMNSADLSNSGASYNEKLTALAGSTFAALVNDEQLRFTFFADEEGGMSNYIRNRESVGVRKDSQINNVNQTANKAVDLSPMLSPMRMPLMNLMTLPFVKYK
jgi:CubicO group peptidase (beta-lactamase class C family)